MHFWSLISDVVWQNNDQWQPALVSKIHYASSAARDASATSNAEVEAYDLEVLPSDSGQRHVWVLPKLVRDPNTTDPPH